jgi:hypothetical protein
MTTGDSATFEDLIAEFVLAPLATNVSDLAYQLLQSGYESPSLAALVSPTRDQTPQDLRDLFLSALRELGLSLPDRLTAAVALKRQIARRVAGGELPPRDGAAKVVGLLHSLEGELPKARQYVGDTFGVARIVGLFYSYDDVPDGDSLAITEIDESIKWLCGRIAEGEDANV